MQFVVEVFGSLTYHCNVLRQQCSLTYHSILLKQKGFYTNHCPVEMAQTMFKKKYYLCVWQALNSCPLH